jgi:hypothetical protein
MGVLHPPFADLSPLERRLTVDVGRAGALHEGRCTVDLPHVAVGVRGEFLAWLLATAAPEAAPGLAILDIHGATVGGPLQLGGRKLSLTPRFLGCVFPDVIDLTGSTIAGFEMIACDVERLEADRLTATGQFQIRAVTPRDAPALRARYAALASSVRTRARFCGATIRGNLDLRGTRFVGTSYGGQVIPLFADGLVVGGNALLSDLFNATGEIRLNGCRIERNLDLTSATLRAVADQTVERNLSLSVAGGRVLGSLLMRRAPEWSPVAGRRFRSRGTVRLTGAVVTGELDCEGGIFVSPVSARMVTKERNDDFRKVALEGDRLAVGGDALLGRGLRAYGEVHLVNGRFDSDLRCGGGKFNHAGDDAVAADGAVVKGSAYFDAELLRTLGHGQPLPRPIAASTSGFIRFPYAEIKQGLDMRGLVFQCPPRTAPPAAATGGVDARFAKIGGSFWLQGLESTGAAFSVDLRQCQVDLLRDNENSWQGVAERHFSGFEYKAIGDLQADEEWRVDKLDAQYQSKDTFEPQPYLWLAKINQQAGYDGTATAVRIRLEKNRTRYGDYAGLRKFGRLLLECTISYGYHPFRAFALLFGWCLFCTALFWNLPSSGQAVETKPANGPSIRFNPFVFALDTLVPIVDLHQKGRWTIQPPELEPWKHYSGTWPGVGSPGLPRRLWRFLMAWLIQAVGFANPFIGWTLTTLFAAGVTGLVRRSN